MPWPALDTMASDASRPHFIDIMPSESEALCPVMQDISNTQGQLMPHVSDANAR
jgi:hypothetical protein